MANNMTTTVKHCQWAATCNVRNSRAPNGGWCAMENTISKADSGGRPVQ